MARKMLLSFVPLFIRRIATCPAPPRPRELVAASRFVEDSTGGLETPGLACQANHVLCRQRVRQRSHEQKGRNICLTRNDCLRTRTNCGDVTSVGKAALTAAHGT